MNPLRNKESFVEACGARSNFLAAYPQSLPPEAYVDALNSNAGGTLSAGERDELINELKGSAKMRAPALRAVAEDKDLPGAGSRGRRQAGIQHAG